MKLKSHINDIEDAEELECSCLYDLTNIGILVDYYGATKDTICVSMEIQSHVSPFSDIILEFYIKHILP